MKKMLQKQLNKTEASGMGKGGVVVKREKLLSNALDSFSKIIKRELWNQH